jgi:hypothetical protein
MTETKTEDRYCSQHRQPRSECRPGDRHSQPLRCSDELFAQVEATGKALGLDRNAAAEQAFREFAERHGKPAAGTRVPSQGSGRERRSAARTEPPAPPSVAAGPDLAATVAQLQRQMAEILERDQPLARARRRAAVTAPAGTAVFLEPGAEPVASFPVPEVPDRSNQRGRRS